MSRIQPSGRKISSSVSSWRQGALEAQMFTALDKEVAPGPLDISKPLEVLKCNGVNVG